MRWDKGRLSHQLTRMQRRGLVERRHNSSRVVMVKITKNGRDALDDARPGMRGQFAEFFLISFQSALWNR